MAVDKMHGGVIISYERHSHGVVELLTYRLRNRIGLTYYTHPYDINLDAHHHFMIVLSQSDLEGVVKFFRVKREPVPLIVYIDTPEHLARINYMARYPDVDIVPVQQANLDDKDVTLKITLFQEIIEHLEAAAAG